MACLGVSVGVGCIGPRKLDMLVHRSLSSERGLDCVLYVCLRSLIIGMREEGIVSNRRLFCCMCTGAKPN